MHLPYKQRKAGFTLVELVIVFVVLAVISAYAVVRSSSPAELTLPSQAQKMASDIRHAQTLAYTWGRTLTFSITAGVNGSYTVTCATVVSPCPASTSTPVSDPATGASFIGHIQNGVDLQMPNGISTLVFNSLGNPGASGVSYTLCFPSCPSGTKETISVAALTGYVTVSP
jgi:prepilin-type N-terminal cleavage/methylation domain-containing protein